MKALNDVKEVNIEETLVNEEVVNLSTKKVLTWEEVNIRLAQKKQELKELKVQQKKLTINSQSGEEKEAEKLRKLKEKWSIVSPLGSELLGQRVSFKSFGLGETLYGTCFSLVLDKRVNMVLVKISCNGKIYHKNDKCINNDLFVCDESDNLVIIEPKSSIE